MQEYVRCYKNTTSTDLEARGEALDHEVVRVQQVDHTRAGYCFDAPHCDTSVTVRARSVTQV
jgi:hypothetical protein